MGGPPEDREYDSIVPLRDFASKNDHLPQEIKDMSGVPGDITKLTFDECPYPGCTRDAAYAGKERPTCKYHAHSPPFFPEADHDMNESINRQKIKSLIMSRDKLMEERDQAVESLQRLADQMEFKGNSVQHWWAKAQAYGNIVHGCTPALERAGYPHKNSPEGPKRFIAESVDALVKQRDNHLNNLAKYGSHHARCAWHDTPLVGQDCDCGLREALGQPQARPIIFECECGNRYNSEFFNAKIFNCFCCGKELIGL